MNETRINTRQIYSLTDFLRNYKLHIANLKETRTPEVLTVNGRAEVVVMDAESYQYIVERLDNMETIAGIRGLLSRAKSQTSESISTEEIERRTRVMDELTAETQRLGLYK